MGKSVLASWKGGQEMQSSSISTHLHSRWKGIPFSQVWKCGWNKFWVRLPSWAARELILSEKKLAIDDGAIPFSEPNFSDMGVGDFQMQVLLRGLLMVWRTEESLRKVVEPFGFLLNYVEILNCEEILLPAKVTVWVSKEVRPPVSMLVVLGGMEVKVQVEVLPSSSSNSYADKVRLGPRVSKRIPTGRALSVGGARQPEVTPKGPPMAKAGSRESPGDCPEIQESSPVPETVDDVISLGTPDCQTSINEVNFVPPTGALLAGQVAGGSLKRKEASPSFATLETELASSEVVPSPEDVSSVLIPLSTAKQSKAIQGDTWDADGVHLVQIPLASGAPTVSNTQHQGEASPLVAFESREMEFLGSPACVKASQIGMIFKNESDKFQFKYFLHKSKLASSTSLLWVRCNKTIAEVYNCGGGVVPGYL
ncbi:hypothetical protein QJS10_CPA05g01462 [Acorus calamus]|uniref:DUF4283 domain-containing protein n=1 Tax=Acorus calamus TaxID=4465 RepID=A0AAV9EXN0_ACOCL|nr:hypothetical protein QJS10_CPA05g01462 [Acorus calamus]